MNTAKASGALNVPIADEIRFLESAIDYATYVRTAKKSPPGKAAAALKYEQIWSGQVGELRTSEPDVSARECGKVPKQFRK